MDKIGRLIYEQAMEILGCERQAWFLGAGASSEANVPMIHDLTQLISMRVRPRFEAIYKCIENQIGTGATIEDILNHLSDMISLAQRSLSKQIQFGEHVISISLLQELYESIISNIGEVIRYGFDKNANQIGTINVPLIKIDGHNEFVSALQKAKKEKVTTHTFFTTNYDTLIEDSLAINNIKMSDGFLGGAIGFWSPEESFEGQSIAGKCNIYKLHGSIDWHKNGEKLYRTRYGTRYLSGTEHILIYPQASKYSETTKNPFLLLISKFREFLFQSKDNVIIFNGYGFGDTHINQEIEQALKSQSSKSTFIITIKEVKNSESGQNELPKTLSSWMKSKDIHRDRIFIFSNQGIYHNDEISTLSDGEDEFQWWKFTRLVNDIILGGAE